MRGMDSQQSLDASGYQDNKLEGLTGQNLIFCIWTHCKPIVLKLE